MQNTSQRVTNGDALGDDGPEVGGHKTQMLASHMQVETQTKAFEPTKLIPDLMH